MSDRRADEARERREAGITPHQIALDIRELASGLGKPTASGKRGTVPPQTRLRALELLGKATGLFTDINLTGDEDERTITIRYLPTDVENPPEDEPDAPAQDPHA